MKSSTLQHIAFNSTSALALKTKEEILGKISAVIDSGIFLDGIENKILEKNLLGYFGKGYVINCASGHDSLYIALQSLGLKRSDEVIFPVNSYPTAFPVCLSCARPIPVDVDSNGLIDTLEIERNITKNTKVIVAVHLYGNVCNLEKIKQIIKGKEIILIEDCAQSFGSLYKKKPVGIWGDIGCFSFYPTKNLGTLGDGGAIWTKYKKLYNYFSKAKLYGEKERYESDFVSFHSRLPELQAGILNVYFENHRSDFLKRKHVLNYYSEFIRKKKLNKYIRVLNTNSFQTDTFPHLLVIEAKRRDALKKYLSEYGIQTHIHYPKPVHVIKAFRYLGFKRGDFPKAEKLSKSIMSLPFHSLLLRNEIGYIISKIKDFYG